MAVVTPSGPLRSLAVIAACIVGGLVGAVLHGAVYEKHGWFSGFGFAFGAVSLGLVASVVVDFVVPLVGIRWIGAAAPSAAPGPAAGPAGQLPPPQHYTATIFSLRLLLGFLGAVAAATLAWAALKLVGSLVQVPSGFHLLAGILAGLAGAVGGWWLGLVLSRSLDLTVE